ncbi:unnamed protein product, partial [Fusarium fujikuroi]
DFLTTGSHLYQGKSLLIIILLNRTFPPSDEPGNNEPQNEVECMISRVQEWGDLIQAVSTQLLLPGTNHRLMRS